METEQPTRNINLVWCPPKNDLEEDVRAEESRQKPCYVKKSAFRFKQSARRLPKNAKKEARERRNESNALLRTIQEFTSVKVVKKVHEILLCKIADVNTTDSVGQTPLMYVVRYQRDDKCLQLIQLLVSHGANLNAKDSKGRSILHLAIKYENYSAAIHLINSHLTLDLNSVCNKGETPLKTCVRVGDQTLEIIRVLLGTKRVNVNATGYRHDVKFQTALHLAATKGSLSVVQLLLSNDASVDCRDGNSRTPLMLAAVNFHSDVVRLLLSSGANQSITDPEGKTAAQLASLKFYGSGLETMNSFINIGLQQTKSDSSSRKCQSTSTQTDPPSPKRVEVTVEPLIEDPEEEELIEVPITEEKPSEPEVTIVEVEDDAPANSDWSNWNIVPWISRKQHRHRAKSTNFYFNRRHRRPTVIAYSRIVRSPNEGPKQQTFYFGAPGPQHSRPTNIRATTFFTPPRRY